jgi:phosphoglycolate phosphatase
MTPFKGCRAVVFDLDGTLADTAGDLTTALNRTLAELDLPLHPEDAVRRMVGGGLAKLLTRGLAAHGVSLEAKEHDAVLAHFVAHYATNPCERTVLDPGVAARVLDEAGIPRGLCTDLLKGLGIAEAFGAIRGSDAGFPRKPDPACLVHVLKALDATPETALMVGDSAIDLETARAAGLKGVVLVTYGYSVTPVTELGADLVINHLHDLVPALALPERAQ